MKSFSRLALILLTLFLSACGRAQFAAVNAPTHFNGTDVARNIAFGPDSWERADIYLPEDKRGQHDVIVFYYGGRWQTGSKGDYRFVGAALARQGYVVVIPDYRKYPDVKFPAFVEDAAAALAWTHDNIGSYGGNAKRIHVVGHSAGAHIGALLATNAHYLEPYGKPRSIIRDFTGLAGPYAFVPDEPDLQAIFGPETEYPKMMASNYIDGDQPPMLLAWGTDDTSVKRINMERMVEAIGKKGGIVETKFYRGVDHAGILKGLTWLGNDRAPVLADMASFFRRH